jgi:uncharacterized protein
VSIHELSCVEARRVAVRAQLLDSSRPAGLLDAVRQLTLLQVDPTAVIAPSADLVAWSRLGSSYSPAELAAALEDRRLIELRAMIRPCEDLALYRADMAGWDRAEQGQIPGWRASSRDWVRANDACRLDILDRLGSSGPLSSRDLPDTCKVPWKSTGWTNNRNVTQLLEFMVLRGEVAVAGRRGGNRLWDLATRVYPDDPVVPADEALRIRNERRLRALGIARARGPECPVEPADVGQAGEQAVVEGVKGAWRVDPSQLGQQFSGRAALLSPFDRLIHDRKRTAELFEFDYQVEIYKPAAKRRWGYFALPILYGDRLVGKLDAAADRDAGVLRVHAIHQDVPFTKTMTAAISNEIDDLARRLELHLSCPVSPRLALMYGHRLRQPREGDQRETVHWWSAKPSAVPGSGGSPAASANARKAAVTGSCWASGSAPSSRDSSARRRRATSATSSRPVAVSAIRTARRSPAIRLRRTRPLRTSRSHMRVAVDEFTAKAAASSAVPRGPVAASTTSALYCGSVTSSAATDRDRAATATSARLAASTASTRSSGAASVTGDDADTFLILGIWQLLHQATA